MSIKHLKTNRSKKYKEAIKQVDLLHGVHNRLQLQLSIQSQASTPPQPEEEKKIISWLSKLKLLYGIPFEYLVIDEGMLPVESIKFFYLDRNWVTALVDGAYSIGRATEGDEAHDTIFSSKVDLHSHISSHRLRGNAFGKESEQYDEKKARAAPDKAKKSLGKILPPGRNFCRLLKNQSCYVQRPFKFSR